jgi:histidinol-phosphate phosphatase family protein
MVQTDSNWKIDSSWSLFLDRDGVINERLFGAYVLSKKEFIFKPGVLEISTELFSRFSHVCVVTNQQSIGKGLISSKAVDELHQWMLSEFLNNGAKIDEVYVAPELNNSDSTMRKPNPALGLEAKKQYPDIDFSRSIMVGDTDSDIEFGKQLGMKTVLVLSKEKCNSSPDLKVSSLEELNSLLK